MACVHLLPDVASVVEWQVLEYERDVRRVQLIDLPPQGPALLTQQQVALQLVPWTGTAICEIAFDRLGLEHRADVFQGLARPQGVRGQMWHSSRVKSRERGHFSHGLVTTR